MTDVAALTKAVGGDHIVVIPEPWRDHKSGEPKESPDLTEEQWDLQTTQTTSWAAASWRSTACTCSSTPTPTAMSATSRRSSGSSSATNPE